MTTAYSRDRTLLFLSFRESVLRPPPANSTSYPPSSSRKGKGRAYDDDEEESTSLIRGMEETIVDFDGVRSQAPPRWLALAQNVEQIIAKLPPKSELSSLRFEGESLISSSAVSQLDKLHSKHLLPAFTDRTAEEREIHLLTTQITTVNYFLLSLRHNSHPHSLAGLSTDPTTHSPNSRHVQGVAIVIESIRSEEVGFDYGRECADGSRYEGAGSQHGIPEEAKGVFRSFVAPVHSRKDYILILRNR